jgi:hypothetical protein
MTSLLSLLLACQPAPSVDPAPAELVVEGGSADEQAAVRTAWRDFAQDIKLPMPEIEHVRIVDAFDEDSFGNYIGVYLPTERVILIEAGQDTARVMYHELCHALDYQHPLQTSLRTAFPTWPDIKSPDATAASLRREAFAGICELRRNGVGMLAEVLAGCDEGNFMPVVDFLRDEVFHPPDPITVVDIGAQPVSHDQAVVYPFELSGLRGVSGDSAVFLVLSWDDPYAYQLSLDLQTGVTGDVSFMPWDAYVNVAEHLFGAPGLGLASFDPTSVLSYSVSDGGRVVVVAFALPGAGRWVSTAVREGPEPQVPRDACVARVYPTVVATEDRVVLGGADGDFATVLEVTELLH